MWAGNREVKARRYKNGYGPKTGLSSLYSEVGEICTAKCEVNGEKIQGLQNALHSLGLLMSDLSIERRQSCTV